MLRYLKAGLVALLLCAPTIAHGACFNWSKTASANGTADPTINWSTGMAPSAVDASGRAMMKVQADCRDDLAGKLTTGGTSTAYTLTTNQVFDTLAHLDGARLCFRPHATNGSPATIAVDGLTAKPFRSSPGVELAAGTAILGAPYCVYYNNSLGEFYLNDFYPLSIGPSTITGSMIQGSTITYGKIQNETTNTILGNVSGGGAAPEEITIGGGLSVNGTTLSAPAVPIPGGFRNLSIKVATNTTVAVAADFVTTTNGTNYQTTPVSCTINLGTTGINALDTGVIAIDSWYFIWIDAKADGTTNCTASLQSTANGTFTGNLPSGYTYYARVGAVRTIHGSATLYGTWQLGRHAQYVVGLAQTTNTNTKLATGSAGSYSATSPTLTTVDITGLVPSTASKITLITAGSLNSGNNALLIAPNVNWGGTNNGPQGSNLVIWPNWTAGTVANGTIVELLLEGPTIAWAASGSAAAIGVLGWDDNL